MNQWFNKTSRRVIILHNAFYDFFWVLYKRESCQKMNDVFNKSLVYIKLVNSCRHTDIKLLSKLLPNVLFIALFFVLMSFIRSFWNNNRCFRALNMFLCDINVVDDVFNSFLPLILDYKRLDLLLLSQTNLFVRILTIIFHLQYFKNSTFNL